MGQNQPKPGTLETIESFPIEGAIHKELVAIKQILQEMLNRIHANDAYAKQMGWK